MEYYSNAFQRSSYLTNKSSKGTVISEQPIGMLTKILMDFNGIYVCVGSWWIGMKFQKIGLTQSPSWSLFRLQQFLANPISFSAGNMCYRFAKEWVQKIWLRKQTRYKTGMTCWTFMEKKIQVLTVTFRNTQLFA